MRSSYLVLLLLLLPALLLGSCAEKQTAAPKEISIDPEPEDTVAETAGVSYPKHLAVALSYEGTQELGSNRGPEIKQFLAAVGLNEGNPYCAAFVSFALDSANAAEPDVRSALAYHFITDNSIEARKVLRGTVAIPPGTILVWRKGSTIYGHTGFVINHEQKNQFSTIEANTSAGPYGNRRDGEGVWRRQRTIQPGNYFRITHFTLVKYG